MKKQTLILAISLWLLTFTSVQAALVTDPGSIPGPQTVIDFTQFTGKNSGADLDLGNDVSVTGAFYYGSFSYSLGYMVTNPNNGYWDNTTNYIASGEGSSSGYLKFSFNNGPVKAVGAFVNYYPGSAGAGIPQITAYDDNDNVLESWSVGPISTPLYWANPQPSGNDGAFRGIVRAQEDIAYFTYAGGYEVLTDLTFTPSGTLNSVPVPGALWLMGSGLIGLVSLKRKKNKC